MSGTIEIFKGDGTGTEVRSDRDKCIVSGIRGDMVVRGLVGQNGAKLVSTGSVFDFRTTSIQTSDGNEGAAQNLSSQAQVVAGVSQTVNNRQSTTTATQTPAQTLADSHNTEGVVDHQDNPEISSSQAQEGSQSGDVDSEIASSGSLQPAVDEEQGE